MSPRFKPLALLFRPNFHLRRIARALEEGNKIARERLLWEKEIHASSKLRPKNPRVVEIGLASIDERNKAYRESHGIQEGEEETYV